MSKYRIVTDGKGYEVEIKTSFLCFDFWVTAKNHDFADYPTPYYFETKEDAEKLIEELKMEGKRTIVKTM